MRSCFSIEVFGRLFLPYPECDGLALEAPLSAATLLLTSSSIAYSNAVLEDIYGTDTELVTQSPDYLVSVSGELRNLGSHLEIMSVAFDVKNVERVQLKVGQGANQVVTVKTQLYSICSPAIGRSNSLACANWCKIRENNSVIVQ